MKNNLHGIKRPPETAVVEATCALLATLGVERLHLEVALAERTLDILARHGEIFYGVEAKVNSPRRAFRQALFYQHVAQKAYVALFGNSSPTAIQLAGETGVGLIMVAPSSEGKLVARLIIEAEDSPRFSPILARSIWKSATA